MINSTIKNLFFADSVQKQLIIEYNGGTFTNSNLDEGSFELSESLCSEQELTFGSCESNSVKFTTFGKRASIVGKTITVNIILNNNFEEPFVLGKYKVISDKATADVTKREVIAYDVLYDVIRMDVKQWYTSIFPSLATRITIKEFRDSFFNYVGIEQEDCELISDGYAIHKTIEDETISGSTILKDICEINGCFGNIGRDNKFRYISLKEMIPALYPSETLYPADDLYPADEMGSTEISRSHYINCKYEEYETHVIDKLVIKTSDEDAGYTFGTGTNAYTITGNSLLSSFGPGAISQVGNKLFNAIKVIWYRPSEVELRGNPCFEVGDGIRLSTRYETVYSYILQRTLKGIVALRDTYSATGPEIRNEQTTTVSNQVKRLRASVHTLENTTEVLRSTFEDTTSGLQTQITQTAGRIDSVASTANGAYSIASQTASEISNYVKLGTSYSGVKITANGIKVESTGALQITTGNLKLTSSGEVTLGNAWEVRGDGIYGQGSNSNCYVKPTLIAVNDYSSGNSSIITPSGAKFNALTIHDTFISSSGISTNSLTVNGKTISGNTVNVTINGIEYRLYGSAIA